MHYKFRVEPVGLLMQNVEELAPLDQHLEKEHQEKTKVKNIEVRLVSWVILDTRPMDHVH